MKNLIRQILREESQGFKAYDTVINPYMHQKFPWWVKLETSGYSHGATNPKLISWHATLEVDSDWYNDLCEKSIFSDCESEYGVRVDLLFSRDDILEIEKYLKKIYLVLTGEKKVIKIGASIKVKPKTNELTVNESEDVNTKMRNKVINLIEKKGLLYAMKLTGFGWSKIFMMVGTDTITSDVMLKFIQDFMGKLQMGFGLGEVGEDPIRYGEREDEFMEIMYFGLSSVAVEVYDSDNWNIKGEFRVNYYNLSDDILMEVFDTMVRVYEDGDIFNIL